jgi:hypothetical protein
MPKQHAKGNHSQVIKLIETARNQQRLCVHGEWSSWSQESIGILVPWQHRLLTDHDSKVHRFQ